MLSKLLKLRAEHQSEKGFTIIEVMIVLAIAGLIIVIVLFAVPQVQRGGRNTGIRSDANQFAGYLATFATDNQGASPTAACTTIASGAVSIQNGVAGTCTGAASTGKIQAGTTLDTSNLAGATITPATGILYLEINAKCPATASTGVAITPISNNRSIAVVYATESSNGLIAQCIGS